VRDREPEPPLGLATPERRFVRTDVEREDIRDPGRRELVDRGLSSFNRAGPDDRAEHRDREGRELREHRFKRNEPLIRHGLISSEMSVLAVLLAAFALPGFSSVATEPSGGQLLEGQFPGTVRDGYVYLPPGFDPATRYPVVYLLHGLPGSPSEYTNGVQLGTFADAAIAANTVKPFIAIVPAGGADVHYGGEWAGVLETALVHQVIPWVDANLPTIASPAGRVIAGLSAGGFGAVDIALRNPTLFGTVESWSGYFTPLPDAPFKGADAATLAAHDPTLIVTKEAATLRRLATRFFVSTGPYHSHLIKRGSSQAFVGELRTLRVPVVFRIYPAVAGEWRNQLDAGITWALHS
jgi:S-formylglutathione hydrolase FrmB